MRFLTKFAIAMALPLFALSEPFPPLATLSYTQAAVSAWQNCSDPWVIDGDSIRCSNLGEVRLLGIDTPDYRDSAPCRGHYGNHICDDAEAKAAKQELIKLKQQTRGALWQVLPVTHDRYGRTVAEVRVGSIELSCFQLANGSARYISEYDNGGRIAEACRR
jgi:endonuclease YncB( thermonuclease family)